MWDAIFLARRTAAVPGGGLWLRSLRFFALAALLALAGGPASSAAGADSFVVTTNFYNVAGTNWWEVHAAKARSRPWGTNMHFDATTRWDIRWKYSWTKTDEGYRANLVSVTGTAVINMPRWIPPKETPPATLERWLRYVSALMAHEQGHVSLARAAAVELRKELDALPAFPTRHALTQAVEARSNAVVNSFKEKEKEYDRRTGHGASQGASFSR